MSLKELLHRDTAFHDLPDIISIFQNESISCQSFSDIQQNVWTLLQGTLRQKKIGLSVLKYCLINLYRTNRISDNIEAIIKWWKAVTNIMKLRYAADSTYRLACCNAAVLAQLSVRYVELQIEAKCNIPAITHCTLSHVCVENMQLLVVLTKCYPGTLGKYYDEIKGFVLRHYHEQIPLSAKVFAQLCCVGSPGRQSTNFLQSWNKCCYGIISTLNSIFVKVLGLTAEESYSEDQNPLIFKQWEFTGSIKDLQKAINEVNFLVTCFSELLRVSIEFPVSLPIRSLKSLFETFKTVYSEVTMAVAVGERATQKMFLYSTANHMLTMMCSCVNVLCTSTYLLLPNIEGVVSRLLQQSDFFPRVLELLHLVINTNTTFISLPYIHFIESLTVKNLNTCQQPVNKKQKREQFNAFTYEAPHLGYNNASLMISALELFMKIINLNGLHLSSLNTELLASKCHDILKYKHELPSSLVNSAYELLFVINSQNFDVNSTLRLSDTSKDERQQRFFLSRLSIIEPHLHPLRYSFRTMEIEKTIINGNDRCYETVLDTLDKENNPILMNMPHTKISEDAQVKEVEMEETADTAHEKYLLDEATEIDAITQQDFTKEARKNQYLSKPVKQPAAVESEDCSIDIPTEPMKGEESAELNDILASFVADPPSDEES